MLVHFQHHNLSRGFMAHLKCEEKSNLELQRLLQWYIMSFQCQNVKLSKCLEGSVMAVDISFLQNFKMAKSCSIKVENTFTSQNF